MAYYDAYTGFDEDDEDPYSPNYGRADFGQITPYRDSAQQSQSSSQGAQPRTGQVQPQAAPPQAPAAPSKSAERGALQQGSLESLASQGNARTQPYSFSSGGYAPRDTAGDASTLGPSTDFSRQGQLYNSASGTYSSLAAAPQGAPQGAGYTLSGVGGYGGGGYGYTGFDFNQDAGNRDTGKSAKYAFAEASRLAAERGVPQPRTKQEAEAWFNADIAPFMRERGYTIGQVIGDKAEIGGWQGNGFVDFLQDADGANPLLAWQAEGDGSGAMNQIPGGALAAGAVDPGAFQLAQQLGIDTSDPLWQQILNDLLNGGDANNDGSVAGLSPAVSGSLRY